MKTRLSVTVVIFVFFLILFTDLYDALAFENSITGQWNVLVFLVEFDEEDCRITHDIDYYQDLLFSTSDSAETPRTSLRDYFREISYYYTDFEGLDVIGDIVIDTLQSWNNYLEEGDTVCIEGGPFMSQLASDLINANAHLDYSQYINRNNLISLLIISPSDCATCAHKGVAGSDFGSVQYSTCSESAGLGAICHEFGHQVGFFDVYGEGTKGGLGRWSTMAGNSTHRHPDVYNKILVGWIEPEVISEGIVHVEIPDIERNRIAYKLTSYLLPPKEYFIVCNRQKNTTFDSNIPGSGLLIYHIDEEMGNNTNHRGWWTCDPIAHPLIIIA